MTTEKYAISILKYQ